MSLNTPPITPRSSPLRKRFACSLALGVALSTLAAAQPVPAPTEIHSRIAPRGNEATDNRVALTLDACGGAFDVDLIRFLIERRIPATLFVTKKWLDANPQGIALLKTHLDLFDLEDHGEHHVPAVIGVGRKVYGIPGEPDVLHLRREVSEGARAIEQAVGVPPHWYRGATAEYDQQAADEIRRMGYGIAGFSVNADAGATLKKPQIVERLRHVHGGDVIIAHMNKPASDSAEGLAVGLADLQARGYRFVRLDQVNLVDVPAAGAQSAAPRPALAPTRPASAPR